MKINTIKYYFLEAIKSLKRNVTLTIISIITLSLVLLIIGIFILYLLLVSKSTENMYNNSANEMIILIKYSKLITFIILPPLSLFLIINQIKMVVLSRKNEISIMKFVGATDWFIRWPFIIQGIIIGDRKSVV